MKALVAVLVGIVLLLGWLLIGERAKTSQLRSEVAEVTSKLETKGTREKFELTEKCALQADKIFRQSGYLELSAGAASSYQSHYNAKQGKCFMAIESARLGTTFRFLLDAHEQRLYAQYMWVPDKIKKYWEVPPKLCKLTVSSTDETQCKTEEEYNAFVAGYME